MTESSEKEFLLVLIEITRNDDPNYGLEFLGPKQSEESWERRLDVNRQLIALFKNERGTGMYVETFPNGDKVDLTLSPYTPYSTQDWKKPTQITLPRCEFTKKQIYETFYVSESMLIEDGLVTTCRKTMVAFLEKLGVDVPEEARTGKKESTPSKPAKVAEEVQEEVGEEVADTYSAMQRAWREEMAVLYESVLVPRLEEMKASCEVVLTACGTMKKLARFPSDSSVIRAPITSSPKEPAWLEDEDSSPFFKKDPDFFLERALYSSNDMKKSEMPYMPSFDLNETPESAAEMESNSSDVSHKSALSLSMPTSLKALHPADEGEVERLDSPQERGESAESHHKCSKATETSTGVVPKRKARRSLKELLFPRP